MQKISSVPPTLASRSLDEFTQGLNNCEICRRSPNMCKGARNQQQIRSRPAVNERQFFCGSIVDPDTKSSKDREFKQKVSVSPWLTRLCG